jgi:hypothetical protein
VIPAAAEPTEKNGLDHGRGRIPLPKRVYERRQRPVDLRAAHLRDRSIPKFTPGPLPLDDTASEDRVGEGGAPGGRGRPVLPGTAPAHRATWRERFG